jgi:hypothetical protein
MFYCIDFDSRKVTFKSESREPLDSYATANDLELAVAIVDSSEELCLQLSIEEMTELGSNVGLEKLSHEEQELADQVWEALEESQSDFETFTGKKAPKQKQSPVKKERKPSSRVSLNMEDTVTILDGKSKSGSILHSIVKAVEEELCETVDEVITYITHNHVLPKSGELADEKYAIHNIKYFVKQGKIELGEEL